MMRIFVYSFRIECEQKKMQDKFIDFPLIRQMMTTATLRDREQDHAFPLCTLDSSFFFLSPENRSMRMIGSWTYHLFFLSFSHLLLFFFTYMIFLWRQTVFFFFLSTPTSTLLPLFFSFSFSPALMSTGCTCQSESNNLNWHKIHFYLSITSFKNHVQPIVIVNHIKQYNHQWKWQEQVC